MAEELAVYDPRSADHLIQTERGMWSSAKQGVIFFETDSYELYTDSKYVGTLLQLLSLESKTPNIGLRVSRLPDRQLPEGCHKSLDGGVTAVIDSKDLPRLIEFFDNDGNGETWTFYGLGTSFHQRNVLKPFPSLLEHIDEFSFVVEIDLDSILMGFTHAGDDLDQMLQRLGSLSLREK